MLVPKAVDADEGNDDDDDESESDDDDEVCIAAQHSKGCPLSASYMPCMRCATRACTSICCLMWSLIIGSTSLMLLYRMMKQTC